MDRVVKEDIDMVETQLQTMVVVVVDDSMYIISTAQTTKRLKKNFFY